MLHIGTLSSGAGSAYACKLMIDEVGKENAQLIFTDTLWEDSDNYRFLNEITTHLDAPLVRLTHGKNPLELAWSEKALPSNRMAFCSRKLKREPLETYIKTLNEPVTLWWGIDIEEKHRSIPIQRNWCENFGAASRFPLIEQVTPRYETFEWLHSIGIKRPRMYDKGYSHANCAGRCVRAGLSHWAHLYRTDPDRYYEVECLEQRWQQDFNKPNTILRKSGEPISLKDFRQQYLEGGTLFPQDVSDGACGCMATFEGKT